MNAVENQVRDLVKIELAAANERFPQFHSAHEGYAVILEEMDELKDAVDVADDHLSFAWRYVKGDVTEGVKSHVKYMEAAAIKAACEAIQVAAMCQKFLEMEEEKK